MAINALLQRTLKSNTSRIGVITAWSSTKRNNTCVFDHPSVLRT